MFRPGIALLLASLALPAVAEIYKWTDAQGQVHYGDQPLSSLTPKIFDSQTSRDAQAQAEAEAPRREATENAMRLRLEAKKREEEAGRQAAGEEEIERANRRIAENCLK